MLSCSLQSLHGNSEIFIIRKVRDAALLSILRNCLKVSTTGLKILHLTVLLSGGCNLTSLKGNHIDSYCPALVFTTFMQ